VRKPWLRANISGMITRLFKLFRWLSLDITAGAVFVSMLFCKALSVSFEWSEMTLLGLSVFVIYTIDHILDVRVDRELNSESRKFHKSNVRVLKGSLALAISCASVLLFFISRELLIWGFGLALASVVYFLISHRISGIKEFSGALIYASGVVLIPIINTPLQHVMLPMSLLFLLACLNLILFSLLGRHVDKKEAMPSFFRSFGMYITQRVVVVTAILFGLGIVYFYVSGEPVLLTIFFSMGLLSHLVIFLHPWFHESDRFKVVGDLTFVFAGILLLF
jgi:hypothetical protein